MTELDFDGMRAATTRFQYILPGQYNHSLIASEIVRAYIESAQSEPVLDVERIARSISNMVQEWYDETARSRPHIPTSMIEKRLRRFITMPLVSHETPVGDSQTGLAGIGEWQLVPKEPTKAMLDAGVAMALQVSVRGQGGWSKYIADLYRQLLSAAPLIGGRDAG